MSHGRAERYESFQAAELLLTYIFNGPIVSRLCVSIPVYDDHFVTIWELSSDNLKKRKERVDGERQQEDRINAVSKLLE